ncbi:MAG: hypothetical protein WKG01_22165 [Kofleriaceae bacterium]
MSRLPLLSLLLLGACTSEPLDVQGTWNLQLTTAASGTCFTPNQVFTSTVKADLVDGTYVFTPSNPEPGDTVEGSFECRESECDFDLTLGEMVMVQQGAATLTTDLEIRINDDLAISGTGNVTGSGAITCTHAVTIGGTVQ